MYHLALFLLPSLQVFPSSRSLLPTLFSIFRLIPHPFDIAGSSSIPFLYKCHGNHIHSLPNPSVLPPDAIPQALPVWGVITIAVGGSVAMVIGVILTVAICCYCRNKYQQNGDKFYAGAREYFNLFLFPFHAPLSLSFPLLLYPLFFFFPPSFLLLFHIC